MFMTIILSFVMCQFQQILQVLVIFCVFLNLWFLFLFLFVCFFSSINHAIITAYYWNVSVLVEWWKNEVRLLLPSQSISSNFSCISSHILHFYSFGYYMLRSIKFNYFSIVSEYEVNAPESTWFNFFAGVYNMRFEIYLSIYDRVIGWL